MIYVLIAGIILQGIFLPYQFWADGAVRQNFLSALINSGQVEAMKYSAIGPILSTPLFLLDKIMHVNFFLLRFNFIIFTSAAFISYRALGKSLGKSFSRVFILLLFFGSMFPGHIYHYYGEVLSAVFMMLGLLLIETKVPLPALFLMILSVGNTPATFIPLVVFCLYKTIRNRDVMYIILPVITAAVLLLDSKFRMPNTRSGFTNYLLDDRGFSTVLPFSGLPGFSYPLVLGIISEIFSFGKGVLFFAPGLIFVPEVIRKLKNSPLKQVVINWSVYLFGLVIVYGKWWAWYGGWFWGPRFLLFASVPASFALAFMYFDKQTSYFKRWLILLFIIWSFWVGTSGMVFGQRGLDVCTQNNYAQEYLCWYIPEFSVLIHPFVKTPVISKSDWIFIALNSILAIGFVFDTATANAGMGKNIHKPLKQSGETQE